MSIIKDENGLTEEEFLKNYDSDKYNKPSVTNDIIIFTVDNLEESNVRKIPEKGLQVLLIKRKEHPYINTWAIPGGFVKIDESLLDGAYRELREETGIDNVYIEQLYTYGDIDRDPRTRVITVANLALVPKENLRPRAADDAKEVAWFWIEKKIINTVVYPEYKENIYELNLVSEDNKVEISYELREQIEKNILQKKVINFRVNDKSTDKLAFDHYKIINSSVDRLRNKIEYTPIAVNMLPRLFTVKDLQGVYEAILGKKVMNFRRKIGDMIVETDEVIEGKPYRPAQMYKYNEEYIHEF